MRFKKIVYFRYIPLTIKIYQDLYMQEAIDSGFDVEYWDLSKLFFKSNFDQEDSSALMCVRKFFDYKELENSIQECAESSLFISIVSFEGRIRRLYRLFAKYNCTIGVFGRNMFPTPPVKSKFKSIFNLFLNMSISRVVKTWNNQRASNDVLSGKIKKYDIVFWGGNLGWRGIGNVNFDDVKDAQIIKINSDDYDLCLRNKDCERLIEDDYILFLDEYLPYHPDTKLLGMKSVDAGCYYKQLNEYFDRVEKQFNMPVIVAAHPKAIKYKECDLFNGRKLFFGATAQLSKFAFFVIAHDSTSINYPVVFGRRLHFVTSKDICKHMNDIHNNIICFSNYLGCNYQRIDEEGEVNVIDSISLKSYQKYKYDFQTSIETEHLLSKDIFIQYLFEHVSV